jgi:hypothetical protein
MPRPQTAEVLINSLPDDLTWNAEAEPESAAALSRARRGVCRPFADLRMPLLLAANVPAHSAYGPAWGGPEFGGRRRAEPPPEGCAWLGVGAALGRICTGAHVRRPTNIRGPPRPVVCPARGGCKARPRFRKGGSCGVL